MYARDTSKKIRSAFATKMKEGSYIGNFAPYGYKKDPENKNHLIIDYETAPIVQEIFKMAERGDRPSDIARYLNEREILTPAMYRCQKRPYLEVDNYTTRKEWTSSMICKMLKNIVYLGHTAQGKTRKVSFKSKVSITNPKEEWYVVENTHAPLITQSCYDVVRQRSVSRKNIPKSDFKNIFSGIAKCMDCGRNMSTTGTRKRDAIANLVCGGYKLYGSRECSNHFIDYTVLYEAVLQELRKQINLTQADKDKIVENLRSNVGTAEKEKELKNTIRSLRARSRELDTIIQKLYEDNVSGKIDENRFYKMMQFYEEQQKEIDKRIDSLNSQTNKNNQEEAFSRFFQELQDITEIKELTTDILHRLVDHIEIGQGRYEVMEDGKKLKHQTVKIYYRFICPFQK